MKVAILAGAILVAASGANAATCTGVSTFDKKTGLPKQTVDFTLVQGVPDQVIDVECFDNSNDTNTVDASFEVFGLTGWKLSDKSNEAAGDGEITFGVPNPDSGQTFWSLFNPMNYAEIFVTLKQKDTWAAFLLDPAYALEGTWGTSDNNDLSHASVYYRGVPTPPPPPSEVPLPAAGWLMIAGLGSLAAMRRRKRA